MVLALGLLALTGKDTISVTSSLVMFVMAVSTVRGQSEEYFYDEWQGPHGHFHKTGEFAFTSSGLRVTVALGSSRVPSLQHGGRL